MFVEVDANVGTINQVVQIAVWKVCPDQNKLSIIEIGSEIYLTTVLEEVLTSSCHDADQGPKWVDVHEANS
jgi:hypothetical protein